MSENTQQQPQVVASIESTTGDDVQQLLARVAEYEKNLQEAATKLNKVETESKAKDEELDNYKKRVVQLEDEALESQKLKGQRLKENEEVESLKAQSEETLTKAKSMLFDKTKLIKNQELQIEALNQQISSLREVVKITKDLLEIRNLEVGQLEIKIKCMDERVLAEKERQDLMHKKLENMIRYNGELKREYETQLVLFSALRQRYSERELAKGIVDDNAPAPGTAAVVAAASVAIAVPLAGSSSSTTEEPTTAPPSPPPPVNADDVAPESDKKDDEPSQPNSN